MSKSLSDLRLLFSNPPASARPLSLTESVDRPVRLLVSPPDEDDWIPMPDETHTSIRDVLTRMKELGFGGIVTNVGYEDYLHNEASWATFKECAQVCRELGLRVWIYDEVGYPSGSADGQVLRDHPELEAEALARSEYEVPAGAVEIRPPSGWRQAISAFYVSDGRRIDITDRIGSDGYLRWTAPSPCTIERYDVRPAFEGSHATQNYFAIRRCINVLNPDAVKRFYDITYQAYIDRLGDDLDVVEAFFTDEPSFMTARICDVPDSLKPLIPVQDALNDPHDRLPQLPWRESLSQNFVQKYNYELLPRLGSLFEGCEPEDLHVRHDFHELVSELYAEAYQEGLQSRLNEHGIDLTGHMFTEESINQHAATQGNLIGALRELNRPGIDMLSGDPEGILNSNALLTVKYGSSAAHLSGKSDVMSEASDWDQRGRGIRTTIEQRRGVLAVQMALGITTFANYFIWHDYDPQAIRGIMDFCARINTTMVSGTHVAPVAVLYPIRTAWTEFIPTTEPINGPDAPNPLQWMDRALLDIAQTLLGAQIDFDFIDSRSLVDTAGQLNVADESYELLIIPPGTVLSSDDISAIRKLAEGGVRIMAFESLSDVRLGGDEDACYLFAELFFQHPETIRTFGPDPDWLDFADAGIQQMVRDLLTEQDKWIDFVEASIHRELRVSGDTTSLLVRQSRFDDCSLFLLVNASPETAELGVDVLGKSAELWNPCDGTTQPLPPEVVIEGNSARVIVMPL